MRLIDVDALRKKVCGWFHRDPQEADDQDECAAAMCMAIDEAPTIDAIEVSEIEPRINDALALLDELNGEGRVEYDAYRRLHDAIGIIGERKEAADGRSD